MDIYISQLLPNDILNEIIKEYHCGLEIIDYSIAQSLDQDQTKLNEYYKTNYQRTNLGVHGPYFDLIPATFDNEIRKVVMKRFNQAYDCALSIGAKYIVYHTGFLKNIYFYESWLNNSIIFWEEFLKDKAVDMPIYIENVFEDEIESLIKLVKHINRPNFKICLDLGHANILADDIFQWLEMTKPYLGHVHLHNNFGKQDSHNSLLTGDIDYLVILDYLKNEHNDISVCLEIGNEKALQESLNLIKGVNS